MPPLNFNIFKNLISPAATGTVVGHFKGSGVKIDGQSMLARPEDFDGADFELQVGGPSFPKHCKVVMKPVTSLCKFC
jgi:hypothetical protein